MCYAVCCSSHFPACNFLHRKLAESTRASEPMRCAERSSTASRMNRLPALWSQLQAKLPVSQLTDNEGRFEFPNIPAGRGMLQAKRPGFFGTGSGRDLYRPIAVGPSTTDHVLALEPAGSITGHVTMPASDPGSNIRVQLMRRAIQEGRAHWQPFGMKLTNSEGEFRFGNLQAGEYKLSTAISIDPDMASSQAPVRWGFPSVSYPQEGDSNTTGFLKIDPGQQLNVQMALTREPFYSVTIPVANRLLQGYSVQISNGRGRLNDVSTFYDSQQQQFRAYLPHGNYTATIQSYMPPGFASEPIAVRNAPVQAQNLSLLPIHPIPVTIRKEFTAANNSGPQIVQIENGKQVEISRDINLMLFSATRRRIYRRESPPRARRRRFILGARKCPARKILGTDLCESGIRRIDLCWRNRPCARSVDHRTRRRFRSY